MYYVVGLRRLEETVEREIGKMPVYIDLLENKVLGPKFKRAMQEGEMRILRRQIEKRFGAIPNWAEERLAARSAAELEELSLRIFDVPSIEDLLR